MNASQIKLIAIFVMLIDHIGEAFFPKVVILRVIGRLAFPIFAYFIAEGYFKTKNLKKYMIRLGIFAIVSQVPFYLLHRGFYLNIFFTLLIGIYAIYKYDKDKNLRVVILLSILAQFLNTDYGVYGVVMIFFFYKYHYDFKEMCKKQIYLNLVFQGVIVAAALLSSALGDVHLSVLSNPQLWIQPLCLISLVFIKYYNGEKGFNLKYLFYAFYPLHLLIIYIVKTFI